MNIIDDDFKEKVATELVNITYDLNLIRKALISISDDIQLNMSYCDVISIVLEENGLASRDEIDSMVLDLNDKRTKINIDRNIRNFKRNIKDSKINFKR